MHFKRPSKLSKLRIHIVNHKEQKQYDTFFINPSFFERQSSATWVKTPIPGARGVHQQWITSGPKTFSFNALITKEGTINPHTQLLEEKKTENPNVKIGNSAKLMSKIPGQQKFYAILSSSFSNVADYELDITDKIEWYESLTAPRKDINDLSKMLSAPIIKFTKDDNSSISFLENYYWTVDKISVRITKQDSRLNPIQAEISFTLTEYITEERSSWVGSTLNDSVEN